ncbi:phage recombination protein Bet [Streptococcus sanguinis]|uniref:phage recombination protein Bet n=1 Tax=Streptococcus sanguinis TaxID=1305 RepID=UPI001CBF002A|nr:phage recombination protein Bet [Streptococcus sanguinis]MBZ2024513.1 phage recombination protein Bet [Streptococcus sanguinis]MBZ2049191.1 phage recombination protein Bet [Streptococcus sanguinis]MBZ2051315.1 phage recombination protein Bet [Streptococcus sanguinis]MBZ2060780.1 phage recombination protein Bet [Streptococcus sanguinis]MCC3178477.1 phage recombination protein Bet [Streptococcus sanguinis]
MANEISTQKAKRDISINTMDWTAQDIKQYFDPDNLLTPKQVGMALSLIKGRDLNPLANEVYIVAYRKKNGGTEFSLIVSKEAFLKRANRNPQLEGFEAGIVVINESGLQEERKGALVLPNDELVGGWARVYRKDFRVPVEVYVSMKEYNKSQSTWNSMPATMIRKTALVNALREAFPEDLGNMYTEDDGGETFDRIKDVTPQESREEVLARKQQQIEQMKQEVAEREAKQQAEATPSVDPETSEVLGQEMDLLEGEEF